MKFQNYTGIILAGGKSSRMGEDKGFLRIGKNTYTEILINTLNKHFEEVIIITNNPAYEQFETPVYEDIYKDKGPLAGLYTGLTQSKTDYAFFIPCDTPFLQGELIEKMIFEAADYDALIPTFENRIYPLTAIYTKNCLPRFKNALENDRLKVKLEIEALNYKYVPFDDGFEQNFFNFNTPDDLVKFKEFAI